jgi:hypothetical protein
MISPPQLIPGVVEENPLNFDLRVDFFRQSDERVITAVHDPG